MLNYQRVSHVWNLPHFYPAIQVSPLQIIAEMHPLRCSSSLDHNGPIFFIRQHSMIRIDHPPLLCLTMHVSPPLVLMTIHRPAPRYKCQVPWLVTIHHESFLEFIPLMPYDTNVTTPSHSSNSPLAIQSLCCDMHFSCWLMCSLL